MAKLVLSNTFYTLPYTTGTIQNNGSCPIEVSETKTEGAGVVVYTGKAYSFEGVTLHARTVTKGKECEIRLLPFPLSPVSSSGGGGGGGGTYILPAATNTVLGGVTTNQFVNGVTLNGTNNLTVTMGDGTSSTITLPAGGTAYTLPAATAGTLGGVTTNQFVNGVTLNGTNNLVVTMGDGTSNSIALPAGGGTYTLPAATPTALGGVTTNLFVGSVAANGTNIDVTMGDGTINTVNLPMASATNGGFMTSADYTKLSNLTNYTLPAATVNTLGGVTTNQFVSSVTSMANNLTVTMGDGTSSTIAIPSSYTLPAATGTVLGGVTTNQFVNSLTTNGTNIDVSMGDGSTSTINLPMASATDDGFITAADYVKLNSLTNYTLPAATANMLGGIKVGNGLSVKPDGTLDVTATTAASTDFIGATAATNGVQGLVPAPLAGDEVKFLAGDGTWKDASTAAGSSNYQQINKKNITAPLDVSVNLTVNTSFCRPPVEVLKKGGAAVGVTDTVLVFDAADSKKYNYDNQLVAFDGKIHLKTDHSFVISSIGMITDNGTDYYISATDDFIDASLYKSIIEVNI